jgi:hypothetical protein
MFINLTCSKVWEIIGSYHNEFIEKLKRKKPGTLQCEQGLLERDNCCGCSFMASGDYNLTHRKRISLSIRTMTDIITSQGDLQTQPQDTFQNINQSQDSTSNLQNHIPSQSEPPEGSFSDTKKLRSINLYSS